MLPNISKKHGMKDTRWIVKDKLTQHKGLIKLYERDLKVLQIDRHVAERKQTREFHHLKKEIVKQREELMNTVRCDPQLIRNVLSQNKNLQRTYQNHLPSKTIDDLKQKNFNKRKLVDRLQYAITKKLKTLTEYKLQWAELQDELKYGVVKKTFAEAKGEIISGKVQEAIIKQDTALRVKQIYKHIIDILKKDRIYFDSVLAQLMTDCYHQSRCIFQATRIGQLATEYTDDRKQELQELRKVIKRDMKARSLQLRVFSEQVAGLNNTLKQLVRKEDDINLGKIIIEDSACDIQMQKDLRHIQCILKVLQDTTYVDKFEEILPCLQQQISKHVHMQDLFQKKSNEKNILINKICHAKEIYSTMVNTVGAPTFKYMEEKKILRKKVDDAQLKIRTLKNKIQQKLILTATIRSLLLHLQQICRIICISDELSETSFLHTTEISSESTIIFAPEQMDSDIYKILADVETRLVILMKSVIKHHIQDVSLPELELEIERNYQKLIYQISRKVSEDSISAVDVLIMDIEIRDQKIRTRDDIKQESRQIVEQNAKPEWML